MRKQALLKAIADDLSTFIAISGTIPSYDCPLRQAADNLDRLTDRLGMERYKFRKDNRKLRCQAKTCAS